MYAEATPIDSDWLGGAAVEEHSFVEDAAWPHLLRDLQRLGATPGEILRIAELVDAGMSSLALCLVDAAFRRLREESPRT